MSPKALILLTQEPRPLLTQLVENLHSVRRVHLDGYTMAQLERLYRFYREWGLGVYEIVDVGADGRELGAGQGAEESDVRFQLVEVWGEILVAQGSHAFVVGGVGAEG